MGIEVLRPILIGGNLAGVREHETLIQPYFRVDGMACRHPVDRGLHFSLRLRTAALRFWIIGAAKFCDLAGDRVLHDANTGDDVGVTQPHLTARGEPEKLFGRIFFEIVLIDIQDAREGELTRACGRIFRIVDGIELIDLSQRYTVVSYDYKQMYRAVIADNLRPELMP